MIQILFCFLLIGASLCADNCSSNGAEQETVVYPVWIGPGLYGGIWFENEEDYNNWQKQQRQQQNHQNQTNRPGRRDNRQARRTGAAAANRSG
jgi:hypothetical protein